MNEERLENIYHQMNELQERENRKLYKRLLEIDKNIGSFEEFVENQNKEYENIKVDKAKVSDAFIEKDSLKKDNINIDLYLIHYNHVDPIKLDNNYKPLPIIEKEVFDYGSVITFNIKGCLLNINGLFCGIEKDKVNALIKYNDLKEKIYTLSEDELLDMIEKEIEKQKNS